MTLLLLEALGALILFVFMVWWTMFSGRKNGELKGDLKEEREADLPASPGGDKASQQTPLQPPLPRKK